MYISPERLEAKLRRLEEEIAAQRDAAARATRSSSASPLPWWSPVDPAPLQELTPEIEEALTAPFLLDELYEYVHAKTATGNFVICSNDVTPRAIEERLRVVLGTSGYRVRYVLESHTPLLIRCDLVIGGIERTGYGRDSDPKEAQGEALRTAARQFGIGCYLDEVGAFAYAVSHHYPLMETRATEMGIPGKFTPASIEAGFEAASRYGPFIVNPDDADRLREVRRGGEKPSKGRSGKAKGGSGKT